MRARDLAQPFPVVGLDTEAEQAALAMVQEGRPGVLVVDDRGLPYAVLPGSQVLRHLLPHYLRDDPALARALDDSAADEMCRRLAHSRVRDLLPERQARDELPVVHGSATSLEVAAVMARLHSPLVAVVEDGAVSGVVTVSVLLGHLLALPPPRP